MAKPFQFSLRTIFLAFVPVAVACWLINLVNEGTRSGSVRDTPLPFASGVVRLDGARMQDLVVELHLTDSGGDRAEGISSGITDEFGRFDLYTESKPGAIAGHYYVTITAIGGYIGTRPEPDWELLRRVPKRYANAAASGLTAYITEYGRLTNYPEYGRNFFAFDLTTEEPVPKN